MGIVASAVLSPASPASPAAGYPDPGLLRLHCLPDGDIVVLQHLPKHWSYLVIFKIFKRSPDWPCSERKRNKRTSETAPWPAQGKVQNECSIIGLEVSTNTARPCRQDKNTRGDRPDEGPTNSFSPLHPLM